MAKQPTKHLVKKISEILNKDPRQLDPMVHEVPVTDEGVQVGIRSDGNAVVDWVNGKAW